jgi:REP-associated tyrosine transposase
MQYTPWLPVITNPRKIRRLGGDAQRKLAKASLRAGGTIREMPQTTRVCASEVVFCRGRPVRLPFVLKFKWADTQVRPYTTCYNYRTLEFDPEKHHRRSIRLRGHDYSSPGEYFVTVCTHSKAHLLGEVVEGEMELNEVGRMVERWWRELPNKFASVRTDALVVMPNHLHGIIVLVGADLRVRPGGEKGGHIGPPLPRVVQWFKTMTTNDYLRNFRGNTTSSSQRKLWHCNYYEHIVRNERELEIIREYIHTNPARWERDPEFA